MSTEIVEQLVIEKAQLRQQFQTLVNLLIAVVVQDGEDKKGGREYRIPRAVFNQVAHDVNIRTLKSGSVVLTIKPTKEAG